MTAFSRLVLPGRFVAVVFDVDGLLADSEPVWERAERRLLANHGHRFTAADRLSTIGRSPDESVAIYARRMRLPATQHPVLRAELVALVLAELSSVQPRPGAEKLVRALAGLMAIGVASNSPRQIVDATLAAIRLSDTVNVVVTGDDTALPKPAPDPYLLAVQHLGAAPHDAIAFEDSRLGAESARAAGLYCVGVPFDPAVDLSATDLIVPSLEAIVVTR